MNSYEDKLNEYAGIDWDTVLANAQKHPDQKTSTAIGVGTDGRAVNMDLWEYTKLDDGTYGLNDENVFLEEGYTASSGYNNNNLVDGKVQGTIPQYIKDSTDDEFIPVTNLNYLFYSTDLSEPPVLPDTVTSMRGTFNSCESLTKMPEIPNGVKNMFGTFTSCTKLTEVTDIPDSVVNMTGTFRECTSLTTAPTLSNSVTNIRETFYRCTSLTAAPTIPNSVTNMFSTFRECTSLTTAPTIPNSVTILVATFRGCSNLQGIIEINANVTGVQLGEEFFNNIDYYNCLLESTTNTGITLKVTGNCTVLQEIVSNANNPNIVY